MKLSRSLIISMALLSVSLVLSSRISLAQTRVVRARVTQAVDAHNLVTLRGNVHPLARPEFDQGVAPDDLPMRRMLLVLQRGADQEASLRQLLDEQQVKASPLYHQWLTPEQFGQQYGPADSDLQAVTDWLTGQGFQVAKIAAGRTVIEFSGNAGLARQVLGTEMHRFRVNGQDYWANASDPQIPAALAPVVAGFASMNNFPRKPLTRQLGTYSRSKLTGEVHRLFTFPVSCGSGGGTCYEIALGPTDFATIYNVTPLWTAGTDGTGQTIAVVGETNINIQDVRDFRTMFGLPANDPHIILNGPDPGIISDETEADLDVQWSGAVAKGATIDLVVSESTETTPGIDLSALYIVDNNLAPVMSISYGGCEAQGAGTNAFHSTLWEQAAAQGITVAIASGDSGSAGCDYAQLGETAAQYGLGVSGLASTPFNVAVGGTDFNDLASAATYWNINNASPGQDSAKSYIPEMPWNDSCASSGSLTGCTPPPDLTLFNFGVDLSAAGGGPSTCANPTGTFPSVTCSGGGYAKPSWQSGPGVPADHARDIPDVSLFAGDGFNASFYVICEMDANIFSGGSSTSCDLNAPYTNFQGVGGTSASAQAFAGVMALVNQAHGRQGNANYVLYPLAAAAGNSCVSNAAAVSNSSCIFYDINPTAGTNVNTGISVICQGGSPHCSNTSAGQYGIMVSGGAAAFPTTAGYDLATGLGTINVANLVNHWTSTFTTSTTTLALSTSPATHPVTVTHGQPVNFDIHVTSGSGTPAGDASLIAQTGSSSSGVTGLGPFTLSGGSVSGSTIMLPGGSYNVTAHYVGNGTFAAGDSSPGIPVVVSKESSKTDIELVTFNLLTGQPSYGATSTAYGSPYILRMNVTNGSGNPCADPTTEVISYACPSGSLTVSPAPTDANPPPGTVAGHYKLNTQGYAEDQPIQQPPGHYSFVASYAGDNSYTSSTSPTVPITITKAPTTTTLTGLPSSVVVGSPADFTVISVATSNGAAPMGTFQFFLNGSTEFNAGGTYSSSSGEATGQASIQESAQAVLPAGSYTVTAKYPGDDNYSGSTSAGVKINIIDFSMSANPSPVTISAPGQTGTSTIKVTPLYGFTGTVNLSVESGCPTGATCTFASPSVTVSGASAVTDMLTITTTGSGSAPPSLQPRVPPSFRLPVGLLWFLAGLLVLAILLGSSAIRGRPAALLFATTLLIVGVWAACGGGGSDGPPPPPPTPGVGLSPPSLTFASQNLGTTSAAQSVTLSNTGTATLAITSIGLAGTNPGDFSQTNTCSNSVASGASCSISAKFTPKAAGARSASVSIVDNASGSPHTIGLNGTGAAAPATPPGTYPIVVNAQFEGLTHALTVNVTVH